MKSQLYSEIHRKEIFYEIYISIEIVKIILTKSHSKIYTLEILSGTIITSNPSISSSVSYLNLDVGIVFLILPIHMNRWSPDTLYSYCVFCRRNVPRQGHWLGCIGG